MRNKLQPPENLKRKVHRKVSARIMPVFIFLIVPLSVKFRATNANRPAEKECFP